MKKQIIIGSIFVALVILIVAHSAIAPLKTLDMYDTGLTLDTTTQGGYYQGTDSWNWVFGPNDPVIKPDDYIQENCPVGSYVWNEEFINDIGPNGEAVVTAWQSAAGGSTAESQEISIEGIVTFPSRNEACLLTWQEYSPYRHYYKVYLLTAENPDPGVEILGRHNNIMDPTPWLWYNTDKIHITGGTWFPTSTDWAKVFSGSYELCTSCPVWDEEDHIIAPEGDFMALSEEYEYFPLDGKSLAFTLKGPVVGALRIEFWAETWDNVHFDWDEWGVPRLYQTDHVYLISGHGQFQVTNTEGVVQSTFEEGDIAQFRCQVDYSGVTQGGEHGDEGWFLRLFDLNAGTEYTGSGTINGNPCTFPVDLPDASSPIVEFTIPEGAFDPTQDNQWRVELWNTLFEQHEDFIFSIDDYDFAPGIPVVVFDEATYSEGDLVTVTATAQANPAGSGEIEKFFCRAFYLPGPPPYRFEPQYVMATDVGGGMYECEFQFYNILANEVMRAEVWSHDGQGRHSIQAGVGEAYSDDEDPTTHFIKITVIDSETFMSIGGVKAVLNGGATQYSYNNGLVEFFGLAEGEYSIQFSKSGYQSRLLGPFHLSDNYYDTITMVKGSDISLLGIVIAIAIIMTSIVVAYFAKMLSMSIRMFMIIVGVAIGIMIFLAMSNIF